MGILVTGSTGFIGNYVVEELLRRGIDVIATASSEENAKQFSWFSKVSFRELDIRKMETGVNYYDFFYKPEKMIHLAWEGLPNYTSSFHFDENLPRHTFLIRNIIQNGLKDITITGTCFEYGMTEGCLNEGIEAKPFNYYAIAKDELRKYVKKLANDTSVNFKWVRLFYMYGKGQNPKSLISQLDIALEKGDESFNMSGGEQERDFLPVEKVAHYIVTIALQDKIAGIINCCSGKPVKVKDFVSRYLLQKGKNIKLNLGHYPYATYEPMSFWGDDTKLQRIIKGL